MILYGLQEVFVIHFGNYPYPSPSEAEAHAAYVNCLGKPTGIEEDLGAHPGAVLGSSTPPSHCCLIINDPRIYHIYVKSKLGFYVPFNSQGHIWTGP